MESREWKRRWWLGWCDFTGFANCTYVLHRILGSPVGHCDSRFCCLVCCVLVRRHAHSEFLSVRTTKTGSLCSITEKNLFAENPFVLNQWSMKSRNTWVNSKDCRIVQKFLRQSGPLGVPLLCCSWLLSTTFFSLSSLWAVTSALKLCSWLHPKEWWDRERKNNALHPFLDSPSFYNLKKKKTSKLSVLSILPTF